jgi:hypothetical protein
MKSNKVSGIDPLFQLFEYYLLNKSYEDSKEFAKHLAERYMAYLDSTPAHLPFEARETAFEDLNNEIQEMLIKKMYGCVNREDYKNKGKVINVKKHDLMEEVDLPLSVLEEALNSRK